MQRMPLRAQRRGHALGMGDVVDAGGDQGGHGSVRVDKETKMKRRMGGGCYRSRSQYGLSWARAGADAAMCRADTRWCMRTFDRGTCKAMPNHNATPEKFHSAFLHNIFRIRNG
ncbi:hypothetical protein [Xanthomonas translucens]|uniref:hypothetical protein n=1 Tax=Xanthomonas campestris pv. translucens TaxID=343 RepID=UPI0018C304BC|nr:hypothetical protein [Xanthomonas translucens]